MASFVLITFFYHWFKFGVSYMFVYMKLHVYKILMVFKSFMFFSCARIGGKPTITNLESIGSNEWSLNFLGESIRYIVRRHPIPRYMKSRFHMSSKMTSNLNPMLVMKCGFYFHSLQFHVWFLSFLLCYKFSFSIIRLLSYISLLYLLKYNLFQFIIIKGSFSNLVLKSYLSLLGHHPFDCTIKKKWVTSPSSSNILSFHISL